MRTATADSVDIAELAGVAARTFPLACPPSVTRANIAAFVDANLSDARFAEYLADPQRLILTASHDDRIVGYAMLIRGVGDDPEVQRAVRVRPAVELSKMYVLPDHHGSGVSTALMNAALDRRRRMGRRLRMAGRQSEKRSRTTVLQKVRLYRQRRQNISIGRRY